MVLSACGGSSSSGGGVQIPLTLSGNWQFTMSPQVDANNQVLFLGGLQGGFLLQNNGSATGAAQYAVSFPGLFVPCNTGSAAVTGTISGQNVALTAVAGTQTFALTGVLSLESTSMTGTYTSTAGTAPDGSPCGSVEPALGQNSSGLQWSATLVPPITGAIQGSFLSTGGTAGLSEQVFPVSGSLTQAANTGASSAAVTGTLSFLNSSTNTSDYPCFSFASVYGEISGNSVNLGIYGTDQSEWGLIGESIGSQGSTGVNQVTFDFVNGGYVLHGAGPSYLVATVACPGGLGNIETAGDFGNLCLALNGAAACEQPITLTPSTVTFPEVVLGSPPVTQTITLANASGTIISGMVLTLTNDSGATNFTETDSCGANGAPSQGKAFTLVSAQSCAITVGFAPEEICAPETPPAQCPAPLTATLTVTSPNYNPVLVPITGTGVNGNASSASEPAFGKEGVSSAIFAQPHLFTTGVGKVRTRGTAWVTGPRAESN